MKTILFLVAVLLINTPLSAWSEGGDNHIKVTLVRDVLANTARSLGWSPEVMVSTEGDGSTSYLIMGESGMAAVYAYASESEARGAAAAFAKNSAGEKSVFHGYPSVSGEEEGMPFLVWQVDIFMFAVMDSSGAANEIIFSNAEKQGLIVGDEPTNKVEGILFEEDFDDGTAGGFGNEAGDWKVMNGKYAPSLPISTSAITPDFKLSTRHSSFGQPDWKYYSVEADFIDAYNGGLIIRGQDSFGEGGIILSIVPGDDIYLPDGFINLQDGWGGAQITGTELGFRGGKDLHIKMECFGETGEKGGEIFKVYVNGELKITTEWSCSEGRSDQGKVYLYLNQHFDEQSAAETIGFTREEIEAEKKHLAGQSWDNIIVMGKKSAPIKIAEPEPTPTLDPTPTIHAVIMLPTSTPKPPPIIKEKSISITDIEQRKKAISVRLAGRGLKRGVVIQGELNRYYDNSTIQRGASVVIDDGSAFLHFRAPYMGWPPGQYAVIVRVGGEIKATRNVEISE